MTEKTNIEQIKNKIKEIMSTNIREYRHHSLIVGEESFGGGGKFYLFLYGRNFKPSEKSFAHPPDCTMS